MAKDTFAKAYWDVSTAKQFNDQKNMMDTITAARSDNPVDTLKARDNANARNVALNAGGYTGKSFKNGGTVKKTGMYKLHAGERVLSTKQRKKFKL